MRNLYCLECDKLLTGKQRKFCCEACRKRYDRTKSGRKSSAFVRESSVIVRESSGNGRVLIYTLKFSVQFRVDRPSGEWDRGLINRPIRYRMAQLVAEMLRKAHPGVEVEVKIEAKSD